MTEHTQKAIEAEAEEWVNDSAHGYPDKDDTAGVWMFNQQKSAYIAGRSKADEEKEKEIRLLEERDVLWQNKHELLNDRIRELEEALRDLYNAIDSLPNWKKRDTLAQHCDMEKAKQLLNNH